MMMNEGSVDEMINFIVNFAKIKAKWHSKKDDALLYGGGRPDT